MTDLEFLKKLVFKTNKIVDLWGPIDPKTYCCSFCEHKIIFSFEFSDEEKDSRESNDLMPEVFFLVFTTQEGGHYKQIIAYDYDVSNNPLLLDFKSLYRAVINNKETLFQKRCDEFFKEES